MATRCAEHTSTHSPTRPAYCACSAACFSPFIDDKACTDAVEACETRAPRYQRNGYSLAVLANNMAYRMKDVLMHRNDYRWAAMVILCNRRYRGTLLRRSLHQTSLIDGIPLQNLTDEAVERAVTSRADRLTPGHYYDNGLKGPSNISLGTRLSLLNAFVRNLKAMRGTHACREVENDELAITMRLGDSMPKTAREYKVAAVAYRACSFRASPCSVSKPRKAVVLGVANYAMSPGQTNGSLLDITQRNAHAVRIIDELVRHLRQMGLPARLRSSPNVDSDLCLITFAVHATGINRQYMFRHPEYTTNTTAYELDRTQRQGKPRPGLWSFAHALRSFFGGTQSVKQLILLLNAPW